MAKNLSGKEKTKDPENGNETLSSGGSRPSDKGWGLKKFFFRPFGPHFGVKIRGHRAPRAPPLATPLLSTARKIAASHLQIYVPASMCAAVLAAVLVSPCE